MKHYSIVLDVVSPLAIRVDHAADGASSVKYIPGSALAGSLGTLHRLYYPERETQFEDLFLKGKVSYPNLYPSVFKTSAEGRGAIQLDRHLPIYPLPKTAQTCKRHPGFSNKKDAHGIRDTLIDHALFQLAQEQRRDGKALYEMIKRHKTCTHLASSRACEEAMDHADGYYRRDSAGGMTQVETADYLRLQTRTGINRQTGTVQDRILYNREVYEEGMQFWGEIALEDDEALCEELETFVREVRQDEVMHIGTGRSRGMGKVLPEMQLSKMSVFDTFQKRLKEFNKRLHDEAEKQKLASVHQQYSYFAVTLHAPLILTDELLRYRGTIDSEVLQELAGIAIPRLELIYQAASVRRLTGWQELWGLPRINEYAIESGSVFLFRCQEPSQEVLRALYEMEERSIGKRRAEGFGRICISDQFHREVEAK